MLLALCLISAPPQESAEQAAEVLRSLLEEGATAESLAAAPARVGLVREDLARRATTVDEPFPTGPAALLLDLAAAAELEGAPELAALGLHAWEELLGGPAAEPLSSWLAADVLASTTRHPLPRRRQALALLDSHRSERVKLALLTVARQTDDPLRPDVLKRLPSWTDPVVDQLLVDLLGTPFDPATPHPFNLLLERVRQDEPLGPRAAGALRGRLAAMLLSRDWRDASRAIELSRGLVLEEAVPLLLDALYAWDRRETVGGGSVRIVHEIVRELRRLSGRSGGTDPKNWSTWWTAVRQGRTSPTLDAGEEPRSRSSFFGLRPMSDRVTFVIDASGSMRERFGTRSHSRYVEAVEQMMRFLQAAGERARFNVILFSDEPMRSSEELVFARAETLERARASLLARVPDGGTYLRPAVELALALDPSGEVDLERLEADTLVVLCDGATMEGRGWVFPLLDKVRAATRIVVHCVLIGPEDDGTLRALAEGTGGDFIQVGG